MAVATKAIEVVHTTDPKKVIWDKLNAISDLSKSYHPPKGARWIDRVDPTAGDCLIAVYQRPEKTGGGILMPETSSRRTEDAFQGTVGMIVKVGQRYEEHADKLGLDRMPGIGEWIMYRSQDATAFVLGDQPMRIIQGNFIRMVLADPDAII